MFSVRVMTACSLQMQHRNLDSIAANDRSGNDGTLIIT